MKSFSGENSRDPNEACMSFYFDPKNSPVVMLIPSGGHNTRACPFSGRYSLTGPGQSIVTFLDPAGGNELADLRGCSIPGRNPEAVMHAGCSDSADLHVEAECGRGSFYNGAYTCHGKWRLEDSDHHMLVLSVMASREASRRDFFLLCLSPTLQDGVMKATLAKSSGQCDASHFNITSSGPCLQALTGATSSGAIGRNNFVSFLNFATPLFVLSLSLLSGKQLLWSNWTMMHLYPSPSAKIHPKKLSTKFFLLNFFHLIVVVIIIVIIIIIWCVCSHSLSLRVFVTLINDFLHVRC